MLHRLLQLLTPALSVLALAGQAVAVSAIRPGEELFEARVRPLLSAQCYSCHSRKSPSAGGGLLLDSRAGLLKGGRRGPAVTPGKPERSLLLAAVRHAGAVRMPPSGPLASASVRDLEEWIRLGAPWPDAVPAAKKGHWAFQPVRRPAVPRVRDTAWVRNPVDAFVLQRLEAAGLRPSPRAERVALLRRAHFTLTGLPPTWDDARGFLEDGSPRAWENLVDRLLASPHYGERWGRHWLDVARYADTKGYVFFQDGKYPWAYAYRDYVIRALNADLPYDRFLLEQLAADQLPLGKDLGAMAAMGFLTVGGRFMNNVHDILDDRIDVITRGLMGLTVACARCHDHKYDPVPQSDYYSLYGVLAASREPLIPPALASGPAVAEHERELRVREQALMDYVRKRHKQVVESGRRQVADYLLAANRARLQPRTEDFMLIADATDLNPVVLNRWQAFLDRTRRESHPGFGVWNALADLPEAGFAGRAATALGRALLPPCNARVRKAFLTPPANLAEAAARYGALFTAVDRQWQDARAVQPDSPGLSDPAEEELRQVIYGPHSPPELPLGHPSDLGLFPDRPGQAKLQELLRAVETWMETGRDAPPRAMSLEDDPAAGDARVFRRGNPHNPGEIAPRRFLTALSPPGQARFRNGSGRLELARAIASPRNPLTARVMVNRIWMGHFGAGLVRTPGDFGARSDPPTHPELLDWLADAFQAPLGSTPHACGWSLKRLHRLVLLSSTFQQASLDRPEARRKDPENLLLWRANRRRLDFETMRDSMLQAAGTLDVRQGGPAVPLLSAPYSHRRSVYGLVDRLNLPGLLRTFDFPSPDATSPQRAETTVAPQALFLMNHPFVLEQCRALARRTRAAGEPEAQVAALFRLLYARPPTPSELSRASRWASLPGESAAPAWSYGTGEVDGPGTKVTRFEPFPHFTGEAWQGGPALPDPKLGWAQLTAEGGHPGEVPARCVIRRWTAASDAIVSIDGQLQHQPAMGNGIRARLIHSGSGLLGDWKVKTGTTATPAASLRVRVGEHVDFVVDSAGDISHDQFLWQTTVRSETPSGRWSAAEDFRGPALSPWEQAVLAHLLANEFFFID